MAVIKFKADQQQSLSGTLCGMIYRTFKDGRVTVFGEPAPVLPHKPTAAQLEKYRKERVVKECVSQIQSIILDQGERTVARMQQVADMHHPIQVAMRRWYDYYRPHFKDDRELVKAIVYYFKSKNLPPKLALNLDLPST